MTVKMSPILPFSLSIQCFGKVITPSVTDGHILELCRTCYAAYGTRQTFSHLASWERPFEYCYQDLPMLLTAYK